MLKALSIGVALTVATLATVPAIAPQSNGGAPAAPKKPSDLDQAGRIASQPGRDVGALKTKIPPILQSAVADPYGLAGKGTCAAIAAEIRQLNEPLGPDLVAGPRPQENRAGKIAAAGGKTVVNTLIPFRALVREATGAAPAQRRLDAAVDAGFARRGFLRGVYQTRRCRGAI